MRLVYLDCRAGATLETVLGALLDALPDPLAIPDLLSQQPHGVVLTVDCPTSHPRGVRLKLTAGNNAGAPCLMAGMRAAIEHWNTLRLRLTTARTLETTATRLADAGIEVTLADAFLLGSIGLAVDALGIERIRFSSVGIAGSTGPGPLPDGATARLCRAMQVHALLTPPNGSDLKPVSAAALAWIGAAADEFGSLPSLKVECTGCGLSSDTDSPEAATVVSAWIGESASGLATDTVAVIETNIDDMPAQRLDFAMSRLFEAGALDVFFTPIQMKKNRPAILVTALCRPVDVDGCAAVLMMETTTLGVRIHHAARQILDRREFEVETVYGSIQVKAALMGGRVRSVTADYDTCAALARRAAVRLDAVQEAAITAGWARLREDGLQSID